MTAQHTKDHFSMHQRKHMLEKKRRRKKIIGAAVLLLLVIAGFQVVTAAVRSRHTDIYLEAEDASMKQGEAVPALAAEVSCSKPEEKLKKKILDKDTGYSIWDLLTDLKEGKNYQLTCDTDGSAEGTYPIRVQLEDSLRQKTDGDGSWSGKVTIHVKEASLQVLNQTGRWEKNKFKKWDDTYVQNDFVSVKGKTYYFGEDGTMVTGWQQAAAGGWYYFDSDGVMQTDQWMDKGETKAYLQSDGKAATGWTDLEGAAYYFNQSAEMLTGKQRLGTLDCVFSKKGKLKSAENRIDPEQPMMALTFDDGPGERTGELLDALTKYGAHATFFLQGVNIPGREDTVKKIQEAGCELGNHSYNHPQLTKLSDAQIREQIDKTNNLIKGACGQGASVIRPPYGAVNDTVKKNTGLPLILWNIDTEDWKGGDPASIAGNVLTTADDGDIVLLHDVHTNSVDAALQLLPRLVDEGYQLVTVSEMAQARGITMNAGETYTDFNK